ncbi:MAG: TerB family tellurite resistance protein [Deltaproteobacteria bacterium]|nr:TerB family tellurite resistance protein [Deltaproteobacteria bacterium]
MFIFKLIGAGIGYSLEPPIGSLLGIIIGHAIDAGLEARQENKLASLSARNSAAALTNQMFLRGLFGMFGKIVQASGKLSKKEQQSIDKIIKSNLKFTKKTKTEALKYLKEGRFSNRTFASYALEFFEASANDHSILKPILFALLNVALSDGCITLEEKQLLTIAGQIFGISLEPLNQSAELGSATPSTQNADPYKILGCNKTDPLSVIRKQFHKLAIEYHPDKLLSKDLPDDFLKYANYRFAIVKQAYDQVLKEKSGNN